MLTVSEKSIYKYILYAYISLETRFELHLVHSLRKMFGHVTRTQSYSYMWTLVYSCLLLNMANSCLV